MKTDVNCPTSASFHARLLDQVPIGLLVLHLHDAADERSLRLMYANARIAQLLGAPLGPHAEQTVLELLPGLLPARLRGWAAVCRRELPRDTGPLDVPHKAKRPLTATATPFAEQGALVLIESLDALQRAESEARKLHSFVDSIIEQMPAMVFLKDAQHLRFERFNRAGEQLLGMPRSSLLGKSDYDFFPREQADFFVAKDRKVLAQKTLEDIPEEPIQTPSGTRWLHTRKIPLVDDEGEPRYLLGISIDITERKQAEEVLRASHAELERRVVERSAQLAMQIDETKRAEQARFRLEEQLRQSQKMEAIGRLAGGVAHDFNNLLSVVLGYSDLALTELAPDHPAHSKIEQIRLAGARAEELTRRLLAFSRRQVLRPRVLDLSEVVRDIEAMLSRLLSEDIELCIRAPDELGKVVADPSQIEQVLMNLVVNARDAMPQGGKLLIEIRNVELDGHYAAEHLSARTGPHVMLAVSDTGIGMEKATLAQIFEPFFTTKEQGKGTGLGLSMVLGIVQQSGGSISVQSEPGQGSRFEVYLPVTEDAGVELCRHATQRTPLRGSETVLLVEDDDQVRALASEILRSFGYRVLEARRGVEAHAACAESSEPIHLLLTDVVMPEVGGRALAEQLLTLRPTMRVLFMSGYTDDAVVREGALEEGTAFLQKPLTPEGLARSVRALLDGPR